MMDLDELKCIVAAATAGPWKVETGRPRPDGEPRVDGIYGPDRTVDYGMGPEVEREQIVETDGGYYPPSYADALLIATARTALPELIARCEELEAEAVQLRRDAVVVREGHWEEVVDERDALRAQVEQLTRERDEARAAAKSAVERHKRDSDILERERQRLGAELSMLAHVVAATDCAPLLEKLGMVTADRNSLLTAMERVQRQQSESWCQVDQLKAALREACDLADNEHKHDRRTDADSFYGHVAELRKLGE